MPEVPGPADTAAAALGGVPGLVGVDHVGIAVPDLDAAVDFHTRVLGLRLTHRETNPDQQVEEAMLAGPDQPAGSVQVQLLAPTGPTSTLARFLERSGPGLQQLAYRVLDVEAAAAHLRAAGVRVLYERARTGTAGSLVNFAHPKDCGGVLVELVQPAADPPAAVAPR
ncbi:methylmalonyl-CoA epimerase [Jannaschia sp. R86511]|uniref:methylmalonyl-CoA epimerase n=1 Tax=Jannaschia sp. R86511 TaxID=3093853 RepID=UPI0036D29889